MSVLKFSILTLLALSLSFELGWPIWESGRLILGGPVQIKVAHSSVLEFTSTHPPRKQES